MTANDSHRYEVVAQELTTAIQNGAYPSGTRMPSLRQISKDYQISMGTATQAYRLLEDRGLIVSRERSGYFVQSTPIPPSSELPLNIPPQEPIAISGGQAALKHFATLGQPGLISMGGWATPIYNVLPVKALARSMNYAAQHFSVEIGHYAHPMGAMELRTQIAQRMIAMGCACSPNEILVSNGCQEAMVLALQAVARPGDVIAIESPTYVGTIHVVEMLGMKALEVPTHPQTGVDLDALEDSLERYSIRACIFAPSCQNPLGAVMPDANKQRLLELLNKTETVLIENDAMGDLAFSQPRPRPVKAWDEMANVIYCGTFSKTLGPGHRVGWMLPGRHLEKVVYLKAVNNITTATWPQAAVAEYLGGVRFARTLNQAVSTYQQQLDFLRQLVWEHFPPGTYIGNPQGGFFLWVELPPEINGVALYQRAFEHGIGIMPGQLVSANAYYTHHIRLGVGSKEGGEILTEAETRQAAITLGQLARELSAQ